MRRAGWWAGLGIRTKLAILIEVAMLALGTATGIIATARQRTMLEGELRRRGLAIAGDLATFAVRPLLAGDLATLRRFVNHSMSQDYVRFVSVLDPTGVVVMHSSLAAVGSRPGDTLTRTALASQAPGWGAATPGGGGEPRFDIFAPVTASGTRLGTVILGYSRTAVETEIAQARRQILFVGLLAALLAGGLAYLLSSYISVPVMRIAGAMGAAARGDLRAILPVERTDEIGVLASSFNTMAEDLSRHQRHLEELVAARTSELRAANVRLEQEVVDRTRAEQELRVSRQQLRDLAAHLQSVREQERTDVAREVHDELGQSLTVLKMDVHWLSQRMGATGGLQEKARAMSDTIDTTVQAVRRISAELRPRLLDDLGLSAAIEWQAREFEERSGIQCDIRFDPDDIVVDRERTTALFRIFQETFTNVARHAGASTVDVLLRRLPGEVELTVADDGRGITSGQADDPRSLGIAGMRERALALGGSLEIAGREGAGTTVRVRIPA
jgi:signal transduction histidine kinase